MHRVRTESSSLQRAPDDAEATRARREIAESLRLLYRARDDKRRHERLVSKLRGHYLRMWGPLVLVLLVLLIWTILGVGVSGGGLGEQLVLVGISGALGSSLAATFKLRDVAELNAFRALAAIAFIQPVIGASLGLLTWLILNGNVITIKGFDNSAWQTLGILAFASGFSEPFFLGTIAKVLGEGNVQGQSGTSPSGKR